VVAHDVGVVLPLVVDLHRAELPAAVNRPLHVQVLPVQNPPVLFHHLSCTPITLSCCSTVRHILRLMVS
jgi:hypothetical protein